MNKTFNFFIAILFYLYQTYGECGGNNHINTLPPGVYIITIGSGESIYEKLGHTALAVVKTNNPPYVFDYMVGDPTIWIGLRYFISRIELIPRRRDGLNSLYEYKANNRALSLDKLNLEFINEERIIEAIEYAIKDNKHTYFNIFYNNCTTRVMKLIFDSSIESRHLSKNKDNESSLFLKIYKNMLLVAYPGEAKSQDDLFTPESLHSFLIEKKLARNFIAINPDIEKNKN
ncbi:DUF4105 domain-containing protein [Methylicorpusculum sp.]|uniref:lipoprotein N-acyltransferase Lnb domain-containing protein n=1 Tax=Methylicorpusculum sp. TaxID=2713644 RepID=UPI00271B2716|nr:DUF4105 domain-containing protein [Methylicorpusculum sp.]MDO8846537.1 DUF4105 domain-containing protein [Methylicorpusculum sp.]